MTVKKRSFVALLVLLAVFAFCLIGEASETATENIPWETPLKTISTSLSGPVAFSLGIFMIVCGFCAVAFVGSELGGWIRWVALAAIAAGTLGAAPTFLSLFGINAAMII
ncbi:MAG: TrbC/VirB2 family protein [Synergistaceae bacterium]|nr:TrbC/VirB2 family protein [Synergistaceae bacterium]